MKSKTFLDEIRKSNLNNSDFEDIYTEFQNYQNKALECLKVFIEICEKNDISYTLAYGSLLGAIRDNGQIPWDYDIDVFIKNQDKNKLISSLKKSLPEKYYFKCAEVDKNCRHLIIRLSPKNISTEVIHVDIFVLVECPDDEKKRMKMQKEIVKLSKIRYYQLISPLYYGFSHPMFIIKTILKKITTLFLSKNSVLKKLIKLTNEYNVDDTKYCIHGDIWAMQYCFETSKIWKTKKIKLENDLTVRVPENYDSLLKMMYGNYMDVPSLESRISEVIEHHKFIKKNINN